MAVYSILIALQASRSDGRGVSAEEFLAPLRIAPGEVQGAVAGRGAWSSGIVYFAVVRLSDFSGKSEPFFAEAGQALRHVARFLESRDAGIANDMRSSGLELRLFVEMRMRQDQMELELPPELLLACGRQALPIYLISNDISVSELAGP